MKYHGFDIEESPNAQKAKCLIKNNDYALIITDLVMEHEFAGIEVLDSAIAKDKTLKVIILTAAKHVANMSEKKVFKWIDKSSEDVYNTIIKTVKLALNEI